MRWLYVAAYIAIYLKQKRFIYVCPHFKKIYDFFVEEVSLNYELYYII